MPESVTYSNPAGSRSKPSLYSHVSRVEAGNLAFIAGQVSADAANRPNEFELQVREVFDAIVVILEDLDADFNCVAEFTIYLVEPVHISEFRAIRNKVFPKLFRGDNYPPSTLLVVHQLGEPNWLIEIKAVVRLPI